MPVGVCALCLEKKELRNSHIIPEFMYVNIYDKDPKRFYSLSIKEENIESGKSRIEQKGIREYLLCDACEGKFSKYEKYADETIFGKNNNGKAIITNSYETPNQRFFLHDCVGFNYPNFKLFLLSLIWRLGLSKKFALSIEDNILEDLRNTLLNDNPLNYNDYPCFVQSILYEKKKKVGGFILNPYVTNLSQDIKIVNILIDGFMYSFHMGKNCTAKADEYFLREDGTMKIIGRIVFDDDGLMKMLKLSYDFFNTIKAR